MIARAEAELPLAADVVWGLTKKTETQLYLSRQTFAYDSELPPERPQGYEAVHRLRLLGFIPAWRHWQRFERVDDRRRELLVRERGGPYRAWNHRMAVEAVDARTCRFVDSIEVVGRPAILTPVVWAAAHRLCRSRMRRLKELADVLACL